VSLSLDAKGFIHCMVQAHAAFMTLSSRTHRGLTNRHFCAGPEPIGARKANLSPDVLPFAQEIALSEQVRS